MESETEIREELARLGNDLRWVKRLLGALAVAMLSPKLGGPDAPTIAAAVVHHIV